MAYYKYYKYVFIVGHEWKQDMFDGGEFGKSFQEIYPEELYLKVEHEGIHATFLNLDVTIENGIFVYKLYDKRDFFLFT